MMTAMFGLLMVPWRSVAVRSNLLHDCICAVVNSEIGRLIGELVFRKFINKPCDPFPQIPSIFIGNQSSMIWAVIQKGLLELVR